MSNNPQIPGADLPLATPGATDTVLGVDESNKGLRRFRRDSFPLSAADQARLQALEAGQSADMLGFATKADMDADLAHAAGTLALVTNDPTAANNGTYRKTGVSGAGSWVLSSDRVTGLEGRITLAEQTLDPIAEAVDSAINDEFLWGIVDALGKLGLALRADGTLQARFRDLLFQGGSIDPTFSTVEEDLFAIVDGNNRVGLRIKGDGTVLGKIVPDEMLVARGARSTLDARISQQLTAYGLPKRHVWGEWYLRETRQRLRKRQLAESVQLVVASIGDSWTHNADRWCRPTARTLIAQYGDAGPGWTGFGNLSGTFLNGNVDTENVTVVFSGTWDYSVYYSSPSPDLGQATSSSVGAKVTVNGPAGVSAIKLFYIGTTGEVRYRFDGGAWTTINTAGSGLLTESLAGIPGTAFSLELEVLSGAVTLCGVDVQKSGSGVRWHKLGATGSSAANWIAPTASQWQSGISALAPNLVAIMLGTNDQGGSIMADTFSSRLQTIIDRVRVAVPLADIVIVMPCENGRANAVPMSAYTAAAYTLAASNKCAFLDLQYVFGDSFSEYASTSARAWFNADLIHPQPTTGGRAIADAVTRLITQL